MNWKPECISHDDHTMSRFCIFIRNYSKKITWNLDGAIMVITSSHAWMMPYHSRTNMKLKHIVLLYIEITGRGFRSKWQGNEACLVTKQSLAWNRRKQRVTLWNGWGTRWQGIRCMLYYQNEKHSLSSGNWTPTFS